MLLLGLIDYRKASGLHPLQLLGKNAVAQDSAHPTWTLPLILTLTGGKRFLSILEHSPMVYVVLPILAAFCGSTCPGFFGIHTSLG